MEVPETPTKLINQLRSWFHPKDRSIYLAANCLAYLSNGAYFSDAFIAETALTGNVTSVTFSNIPQTFRHLMIMASTRVDTAVEVDNAQIRFNGDTGANYDYQQLFGNSATATASAARATTSAVIGAAEGANSRANCFAPGLVWIFDYSRTIEKRMVGFTAVFGNLSADADMFALFRVGNWRNPNVITSITIIPATGPNFVSGSRFQLYGIL